MKILIHILHLDKKIFNSSRGINDVWYTITHYEFCRTKYSYETSITNCQHLELLLYFGKGFRSFHKGNIGSVDQKAAKFLAVKVGVLKKKSATSADSSQIVCKQVRPGFDYNWVWIILKVWWRVILQPFDLQTPNFQYQKI